MNDERFLGVSGGDVIRYRVDGPPGARRMLLYNGLVSSALHWRHWVAHYRRRYAVITWDYRGHGPFELPRDMSRVSIEGFARDGHEVLAAAGGGPAILCGISMGVQTVLEHLRLHPGDAAGAILLCGTYGHPLDRLGGGRLVRGAVARLVRWLSRTSPLARATLFPALSTGLGREIAYLSGGAHREYVPPEFLDELFAHVRKMHPRVIGAILSSWVEHSAEDVLARIGVPTLIFAGDRDELTPPDLARVMSQRISGAELHVVEGHSHLLQVERPDLVHDLVDAWLGRKGL